MEDGPGGTIVGRYQRYKAGTKHIVTWLATTAAQHCKLRDVLDCLKVTPASHRGKPAWETIVAKVRVKSHELVVLAEIIASIKAFTVPAGIIKILHDVIEGRQDAAEWYASQTTEGDSELAEQNERHVHFISILQKVQRHLDELLITPGSEMESAAVAKSKKKQKSGTDTPAKPVDEMRNLFDYLDVEEPSAFPLGQHGPSKSAAKHKTTSYELDSDEDQDVFALWCHLKDMSDTRLFVREVWAEYRRGDVTIEVAGTVADTAIGLMIRAHEEFAGLHDLFDDFGDIMDFLKLQLCFNNNAVCVFPRGANALADHFLPDTKPTDLLCPTAAMLVRAFQDSTLSYYQDWWSGYIKSGRQINGMYARTPVTPSSFPHPTASLSPRLLSIVPEMCGMKKLNEQVLKTTTFSMGLQPLIGEPGEMGQPMSMVFAFQICMDIDELVESDWSCGGDTILRTSSQVTTTIDGICNRFNNRASFGLALPEFMAIREQATDNQEAVKHARRLEQPHVKLAMTVEEQFEHHRIKCLNPTLNALPHCAGTASYSLKLQVFNQCTMVANENSVMILLAHFYCAARRYGLVTEVWHDLDFLVAQHNGGVRGPFMTKTDSTAADKYANLKAYVTDLGCSTSNLPRNAAPQPPTLAALDMSKRIDGADSTMLTALRRRTRQQIGKNANICEVLDAVLSSMATKMRDGKQTKRRHQFSPIQLLATLKDSLIADEPKLNFSYFEFTEVCLELLLKLVLIFQASNKSCKCGFQAIYYMLKSAAEANASSIANTAFGRAAALLQAELHAMDTSKFSRAALHASSGHIPKPQRPNYGKESDGTEPELVELLEKFPEISVGTSRGAFEFYDPAGSFKKFSAMLIDGSMEKFMSGGARGVVNGTMDNEAWDEVEGHENGSVLVDLLQGKRSVE